MPQPSCAPSFVWCRAPAHPPLRAPPPAQPQPRRAAGILLGRQKPPQPSGHGAPQGSTATGSALCAGAEVSGDGAAFSFLSTALPAGPGVPQGQPCSLYCSSPIPAQHKQAHISTYLFIFPSFQPPLPPITTTTTGFEQPEADPGSNVGCRRGAAPLQFHLGRGGAAASDTAAERLSLELPPRTLPLMDHAIFFSLLFTLYCSCFCTGKRCWSAQKSFRSRLAAELCLIIVIIWKQVMGIFPMLI